MALRLRVPTAWEECMKYEILPGAIDRSELIDMAVLEIRSLAPTRAWTVEVKRYVKTKTNKQTAALFGLAYPILARETGHGVNDWHEYFCGEHFGWVERNFFGRRKLEPARTLTTGYNGEPDEISAEGCASLFDFVQARAAQNNIIIPDPDPHWRQRRRHKEGEFADVQKSDSEADA